MTRIRWAEVRRQKGGQREWTGVHLAGVLSIVALGSVVVPDSVHADACATTPLVLSWDSTKTTGLDVDLHVRTGGSTVDWGDGTTPTIVPSPPTAPTAHTYATGGTYTISICGVQSFGKIPNWMSNRGASGFTAVTGFASTLTDLGGAFYKWTNLTDVPNALPASVTTLNDTFNQASTFNDPDVSSWDISNVTNLTGTFMGASVFNQPLNSWNTSKVTLLTNTFSSASVFNQPLDNWDTSKVTDLSSTFSGALAFDQNLGSWDVSKVTNMKATFSVTWVFNNGGSDSIKNWNTANNTSLDNTFANAKMFNQPIGSWNTAKVTTTSFAFAYTQSFNQDIGSWNLSMNTKMNNMFSGALAFNNGGSPSINNWNTSNVTKMDAMFREALVFNQPIGNWNVGSVVFFNDTFSDAGAFDQDISNWNPASLGIATSWKTTNNVMSIANYDKLLMAWSTKTLPTEKLFGWGQHKYSCAAEAARITMSTAPWSWTMTDGGLAETAPTIATIVSGDGTLSVYVTAPTCMSSQRTSYQYSIDDGATWVTVSPGSLASPIEITGLTNDQTYQIKVQATGGTIGVDASGPASQAVSGTPTAGGGGGGGGGDGSGGGFDWDIDLDHYIRRAAAGTLPDTL